MDKDYTDTAIERREILPFDSTTAHPIQRHTDWIDWRVQQAGQNDMVKHTAIHVIDVILTRVKRLVITLHTVCCVPRRYVWLAGGKDLHDSALQQGKILLTVIFGSKEPAI